VLAVFVEPNRDGPRRRSRFGGHQTATATRARLRKPYRRGCPSSPIEEINTARRPSTGPAAFRPIFRDDARQGRATAIRQARGTDRIRGGQRFSPGGFLSRASALAPRGLRPSSAKYPSSCGIASSGRPRPGGKGNRYNLPDRSHHLHETHWLLRKYRGEASCQDIGRRFAPNYEYGTSNIARFPSSNLLRLAPGRDIRG